MNKSKMQRAYKNKNLCPSGKVECGIENDHVSFYTSSLVVKVLSITACKEGGGAKDECSSSRHVAPLLVRLHIGLIVSLVAPHPCM